MVVARLVLLRTTRELGLRLGSSAASLILILALARSVPSDDFVASQVAMIAVGLGAVVSDAGLVLYTTRSVALGHSHSIGHIASTRLLLTGVALLAGSLLVGRSGGEAGVYVLILGPYLISQVLRNHVYAQVRAVDGVGFELTFGPVANLTESLIAAGIVTATASVTLCYSALSLSALPLTVVVTVLAVRKCQVQLRLRKPSLRLLVLEGRSGFVPLAAGAALKTFGLVLGSGAVTAAAGTNATAWLLACIRCLDAANIYLTTRIIVADHARASRGLETSMRSGLWIVAVAYLLSASALPLALLGAAPPQVGWLLGLILSVIAFLWFALSKAVHASHGYRGESPWWALIGAHSHLAVLPFSGALGATATSVLIFLIPVLAVSVTLCMIASKGTAVRP